MVIGILSDTHDRVETTRAAVEMLRVGGAEYYLHCGDVGSELVLDVLAGLPSAFVFGNNDWDRRGLQRYAEHLRLRCLGDAGEVELGGKSFCILHGDDLRRMRVALDAQRFDYLLHGHTHVKRDERVGRTRVINPGALHRAREKTVALLDTATDGLRFLAVKV